LGKPKQAALSNLSDYAADRTGAIMTKELSQSLKQGIRSNSAILAPSPANAPPDRLLIYPLDMTAHAFFYGAIAKAGFPS
jgi:hypothetical protein